MREATSCSSSARSTAGVAAQPRAASRAPEIAASSCSGEAEPSSVAVSSVVGFSTMSVGPSPAICSPRISSLVSMWRTLRSYESFERIRAARDFLRAPLLRCSAPDFTARSIRETRLRYS